MAAVLSSPTGLAAGALGCRQHQLPLRARLAAAPLRRAPLQQRSPLSGPEPQPSAAPWVCRADTGALDGGAPAPAPAPMNEAARKALFKATRAVRRYGWTSFWAQLTLSIVSAVILLFSVAFTSQGGPRASLYLTLLGIVAGFLSAFWNFGYTRTALRMQEYLDAPPSGEAPKVKKQAVVDMVTRGVVINVVGLGATMLSIQALVGLLVAKTLSNASANPFLAAGAGTYNPVLALDVFLVQAASNMLLGHFLSLCCSLWLLGLLGEGKGLRFQVA